MLSSGIKISSVLIALSLLGACKSPVSEDNTQIELWPAMKPALPVDKNLEDRITTLVSKMSVEEKVGQITQPEIKYVTPEDVRQYHLGSILNGGGTAPNNDKFAPISEWVNMAQSYYEASMDTSDGKLAIPIIWGSDAVHGHNNVVGATLFPHNIGLGAARDSDLIYRIGEATAQEVAVTGVDWTFAPTVAVVRDDRWGRTYESYSEDPAIVEEYARMMIDGLQGVTQSSEFLDNFHVVGTVKHFVGDGGTHRGIDRGDTQTSEQDLIDIHSAGFFTALESGVQTVMASFNSWNGVRLHGHHYLLTDVLKQRLKFDGFVVGDWNGHRFVPGCQVDSCAAAINAGLDMFMVPSDWKALYINTLEQAKTGEIIAARLDDAVRRILRVKIRAGLFDIGPVTNRELAAKTGIMGGENHRKLAREAARKSLVLLKNNNNTLPINPEKNILVVGDAANSITKQSGGWTLSWQGTGNQRSDFPGATTIFEGIEHAVKLAGGQALLSEEGSDVTFNNGREADVIIAVYGEEPYAEWHGDIAGIEYQRGSKVDLELLKKLKQKSIPIASVFISGRPLWVNKEINASDAFVAAWLPGSEGAAIADVLLANKNTSKPYDFQGKLSFSWPRYVHQAVLNKGDTDYHPLFAYGYGLTYTDDVQLASNLPEDGDTFEKGQLDDAWLMVSRTMAPWKLYLRDHEKTVVEVTGNRASSNDNNLSVASVDMLSQEDARQFVWLGNSYSEASFSAQRPQNLSAYGEENAALQMDIKLDQASTESVFASIECGETCQGKLRIDEQLNGLIPKQWQSLSFDLSCFSQEGADLSQVSSAFTLSTSGQLGVSLANVKWVPGKSSSATVSCQPTTDLAMN